jgi:hypothetical protein
MLIPAEEAERLAAAVFDALELAHDGQPAEGYTVLLAGLARAQAGAEEWGPDLVERWEWAVEVYAQRWGIGRA